MNETHDSAEPTITPDYQVRLIGLESASIIEDYCDGDIERTPQSLQASQSPDGDDSSDCATQSDEADGAKSYFVVSHETTPAKPLKHRCMELVNETDSNTTHIASSAHAVRAVHKWNTSHTKSTLCFFKPNDPVMSQIEATLNSFYRLHTPEAVASSQVMYDADHQIIGICSKALPGFLSVMKAPLHVEEIDTRAKALARMLVMRYVFQDDDTHRKNISKQGLHVDYDCSEWPITALVKGPRTNVPFVVKAPEQVFPINEEDILDFPCLKHATPFYWPTSNNLLPSDNGYSAEEAAVYMKLKDNQAFIREKYKMFLKYLLIPAEIYEALARLHIQQQTTITDKPAIAMLVNSQRKRIQDFQDTLTKMPDFVDRILSQEGCDLFSEILEEIEQHNTLYQKEKYTNVRISPDFIQKQFEKVRELCLNHQILGESVFTSMMATPC